MNGARHAFLFARAQHGGCQAKHADIRGGQPGAQVQRDGSAIAQFLPRDVGAPTARTGQPGGEVVDEDAGLGRGQVVGQCVAPIGVGIEPILTGLKQGGRCSVRGGGPGGMCADLQHAVDELQHEQRGLPGLWQPRGRIGRGGPPAGVDGHEETNDEDFCDQSRARAAGPSTASSGTRGAATRPRRPARR